MSYQHCGASTSVSGRPWWVSLGIAASEESRLPYIVYAPAEGGTPCYKFEDYCDSLRPNIQTLQNY